MENVANPQNASEAPGVASRPTPSALSIVPQDFDRTVWFQPERQNRLGGACKSWVIETMAKAHPGFETMSDEQKAGTKKIFSKFFDCLMLSIAKWMVKHVNDVQPGFLDVTNERSDVEQVPRDAIHREYPFLMVMWLVPAALPRLFPNLTPEVLISLMSIRLDRWVSILRTYGPRDARDFYRYVQKAATAGDLLAEPMTEEETKFHLSRSLCEYAAQIFYFYRGYYQQCLQFEAAAVGTVRPVIQEAPVPAPDTVQVDNDQPDEAMGQTPVVNSQAPEDLDPILARLMSGINLNP